MTRPSRKEDGTAENAAASAYDEAMVTLPRRLLDDLHAVAGGYHWREGRYIDTRMVRNEVWPYLSPDPGFSTVQP